MMGIYHLRTSNQIISYPSRKLPAVQGGTHAITTADPNTLNTNTPLRTDGHGIAGTQCMVTLAIGTLGAQVTITVWVWNGAAAKWLKLGANSTQYNKAFDSNTVDGFSLPEKAVFYLQGSATVDEAYTDAGAVPS